MYYHREILSLRVGFKIHNFKWDYIDDLLVPSKSIKNLISVIKQLLKAIIQRYIGFVAIVNEITETYIFESNKCLWNRPGVHKNMRTHNLESRSYGQYSMHSRHGDLHLISKHIL